MLYMANNELEDFRKKWISEIEDKGLEEKNSANDKRKNDIVPEQSQNNRSKSLPTEKIRLEQSESNQTWSHNSEDYEAFKIANKYLNISDQKNCKHCNHYENKHLNSSNIAGCSTKRKYSDGGSQVPSSNKKKMLIDQSLQNDSLVDTLIADIDEITCIPFFDNELPKEIAVKIFQFLSLKDLASCALVSKEWQIITDDDLLWFNIYEKVTGNPENLLVIDQNHWKRFVKNYFMEKKAVQRKWKERLCEVLDLENEKGGIVCAADICEETAVISYLDGSIKLWNLADGSFGYNLKEKYTNDEDIITKLCAHLCLSTNYCIAAFQNGDVMFWRIDENLSGELVYMMNNASSEISDIKISDCNRVVALLLGSKVIMFSPAGAHEKEPEPAVSSEHRLDLWNWTKIYEKEFSEKICDLVFGQDKIFVSTKHKLHMERCHGDSGLLIDQVAGAVFSCMDDTKTSLVVGINSFGYSILGGFRIRRYCKTTGEQLSNIVGPQCKINCIKIQDGGIAHDVAVGCSDGIIRIYNMINNCLMTSLPSYESTVTSLQMDDWKLLSGHSDGTVILWDRNSAIVCWQTQMKHPVYMCKFNNRLLTSINIPLDKLPKNSNWYVDDLVQHRKYRGSIRVMDFTKDVSRPSSLPQEFCADYDNITGYDYNIQLAAPYDNVDDYMNLPKM